MSFTTIQLFVFENLKMYILQQTINSAKLVIFRHLCQVLRHLYCV